jgi:Ulp1 protease family, C-terminal catalytic domain
MPQQERQQQLEQKQISLFLGSTSFNTLQALIEHINNLSADNQVAAIHQLQQQLQGQTEQLQDIAFDLWEYMLRTPAFLVRRRKSEVSFDGEFQILLNQHKASQMRRNRLLETHRALVGSWCTQAFWDLVIQQQTNMSSAITDTLRAGSRNWAPLILLQRANAFRRVRHARLDPYAQYAAVDLQLVPRDLQLAADRSFSTISVNTTLEDQSQLIQKLAANPSTPGLYWPDGIAPNGVQQAIENNGQPLSPVSGQIRTSSQTRSSRANARGAPAHLANVSDQKSDPQPHGLRETNYGKAGPHRAPPSKKATAPPVTPGAGVKHAPSVSSFPAAGLPSPRRKTSNVSVKLSTRRDLVANVKVLKLDERPPGIVDYDLPITLDRVRASLQATWQLIMNEGYTLATDGMSPTVVDGLRALNNGPERNDLVWVVQYLRVLFLQAEGMLGQWLLPHQGSHISQAPLQLLDASLTAIDHVYRAGAVVVGHGNEFRNGVTVESRDRWSFMVGKHHDGWLTGPALVAGIQTIRLRHLDRRQALWWVVCPTQWAQFDDKLSGSHPGIAADCVTEPERDHNLLIPLHLHGDHWALGVIDLHLRRWEYLDSGRRFDNHDNAPNKFEMQVSQFVPALYYEAEEFSKGELESGQQTNTWDCGVWVIENARAVIEQRDLPKELNCDFQRGVIVEQLARQICRDNVRPK